MIQNNQSIDISEDELNERIAILKRLKSVLLEQRKKFKEYLVVLEKQAQSIDNKDTDVLLSHAELEQSIVKNITNLQKVTKPLESLYSDFSKDIPLPAEIPSLKADLVTLQKKVLAQNEKNRMILKSHLNTIKAQITQLQNPYKTTQSVYVNNSSAQIINIQS